MGFALVGLKFIKGLICVCCCCFCQQIVVQLRPCLYGIGGPQIGAVTWRVTPRDQIKMRDYVDRRVTSLTWGPPD